MRENELDALEDFLRACRLRAAMSVFLQAVIAAAGAFAAIFCLGVLGVAMRPGLERWAGPCLMAASSAAVAVPAWLALSLLMPLRRLSDVAFRLEARNPGLCGALSNAESFGRALRAGGKQRCSTELMWAAIRTAAESVGGVDASLIQASFWKPGLLLLTFSAFCLAALEIASPGASRRLIAAPSQATAPSAQTGNSALPVSDVSVAYRYPSYTGMPEKRISGCDGNLSALKGSEASLTARLGTPAQSAEVALLDGTRLPARKLEDGRFEVRLPILNDSSYKWRAPATDGGTESAEFRIEAPRDEMPSISAQLPADRLLPDGTLSVSGRDDVSILYDATDDFGIAAVDLVVDASPPDAAEAPEATGAEGGRYPVQWENKPEPVSAPAVISRPGVKRIPIARHDKPVRNASDLFRWSLADAEIPTGRPIPCWLECLDNDTVTGPKRTAGRRFYLLIDSRESELSKLIAAQEAFLREALAALAALLTKTPDWAEASDPAILLRDQTSLFRAIGKLLLSLEGLTSEMAASDLADAALLAAMEKFQQRLTLAHLEWGALIEPLRAAPRASGEADKLRPELAAGQSRVVAAVEDGILELSAGVKRERGQLIQLLREKVNETLAELNRLKDLLKEKPEDASLREHVMAQARLLRSQLEELREQLAELSKELPAEFANADALRREGETSLDENYARMEAAFESGDIEEAMRLAQELASNLERAAQGAQLGLAGYQQMRYGADAAEVGKLAEKLKDIEKRETELARKTREAGAEARQAAQTRLQGMQLEDFFRRQEKRVAEIKSLLNRLQVESGEQIAQQRISKRAAREALTARLRDAAAQADPMTPEERAGVIQQLQRLDRDMAQMQTSASLGDWINAQFQSAVKVVSSLEHFLSRRNAVESLNQAKRLLVHAENIAAGLGADLGSDDADPAASGDAAGRGARIQLSPKTPATDSAAAAEKDDPVRTGAARILALDRAIISDIENLLRDAERGDPKSMSSELKETLAGQRKEQDEIRKDLAEAAAEIDKLSKRSPVPSEEASECLQSAGGFMEDAGKSLGQLNPSTALDAEQNAISELGKACKGLEEAMQTLQKAAKGQSVPLRHQAFGMFPPYGPKGINAGFVKIPGPESHEVPREYREAILEAMRRGLPREYEELNRDYYSEMVK
ncbi:MAG TPA: hypothetical protein PL033_16465 [Candidatus Brocadiia bacterium]|nr:hypothetical protein [Candidatus Brocadiia bacterium]